MGRPAKKTQSIIAEHEGKTIEGKYYPTPEQQKLLEVLLNPEHQTKPITEMCAIAGIDRRTYYNAFNNEKFVNLYLQKGRELIKANVVPILRASLAYAQSPNGFQDRKMLLEYVKEFVPELTLSTYVITEGNDTKDIINVEPEGK